MSCLGVMLTMIRQAKPFYDFLCSLFLCNSVLSLPLVPWYWCAYACDCRSRFSVILLPLTKLFYNYLFLSICVPPQHIAVTPNSSISRVFSFFQLLLTSSTTYPCVMKTNLTFSAAFRDVLPKRLPVLPFIMLQISPVLFSSHLEFFASFMLAFA